MKHHARSGAGLGVSRVWRTAVLAVLLALFITQGDAQNLDGATPQVDATGALVPRPVVQDPSAVSQVQTDVQSLNYVDWDQMAGRAEKAIENRNAASLALESVRKQLVDWREALLGAQNANVARIATIRAQITALGAPPSEGQSETAEIAQRRVELSEQLVRLQAPGIAAEEAYRRADGLIREIDRVLRERQADALLQLWPAPINPANWPEAVIALTDTWVTVWDEITSNWQNAKAQGAFFDNLPLILLLLGLSVVSGWYGRLWIAKFALRLESRGSARGRVVWSLLASLGEVALPLFALFVLLVALVLTEMPGEVARQVIDALPNIVVPAIVANWLGGRIFPRGPEAGALQLSQERRAEGRYHAVVLGILLGVDALRGSSMDPRGYSDGATSVLSYPILAIAGLILFRIGQLLRSHVQVEGKSADPVNYANRLLGLLSRAAMVIGVVGPVLGAVGYVAAAKALVYPAILSLSLVALLLILQQLVVHLYALLVRRDGDPAEALFPVLANFGLSLLTIPIFALIWGARFADLTELWTRFREGFTLGTTRISPTDFLLFAVVFGIGMTLTRMFQGALKSSILPRTSLDQGGQNAVVSGIGYVGILCAALIAINAAGIDLSGLAIVAGALSVGIGFGLQAVVSNFVSGIILLIERPVSEGDWIEVGTTQGIVKSISVRSTRIQTFDRSDVIVPNSDLISGRVTNWTRFNLSGRLMIPVSVPFTTDSRRVEAILRDIAEAQPLALLNPPPIVAFMGFSAEVMNFEIRMILRDVNFQLAVRSEVNHEIARKFAEAGIHFSNAHRDHLQKLADQALAEAELLESELEMQGQLSGADMIVAPDPKSGPKPRYGLDPKEA